MALGQAIKKTVLSIKLYFFFLPINLNMCFGAQKNCLIETVLMKEPSH